MTTSESSNADKKTINLYYLRKKTFGTKLLMNQEL